MPKSIEEACCLAFGLALLDKPWIGRLSLHRAAEVILVMVMIVVMQLAWREERVTNCYRSAMYVSEKPDIQCFVLRSPSLGAVRRPARRGPSSASGLSPQS